MINYEQIFDDESLNKIFEKIIDLPINKFEQIRQKLLFFIEMIQNAWIIKSLIIYLKNQKLKKINYYKQCDKRKIFFPELIFSQTHSCNEVFELEYSPINSSKYLSVVKSKYTTIYKSFFGKNQQFAIK